MRRTRILITTVGLSMLLAASFVASASWQGTWIYYNKEGAQVGKWTAGCGAADGRWGVTTENKIFIQGCKITDTQ